MIQGAQPYIPESDRKQILKGIHEILQNGQFTQGKHLNAFETASVSMSGTKFALGVNSCGTGLELIFEALDVRGKEVIVPTETFLATANAVTRAGGTPVFADIDPTTLSLSVESIESCLNEKTVAIAIVHMFGIISPEIHSIQKLCREKNLYLVEDAAHAHGANYQNIPAGSLGDIACFSFYATKTLTTGEGGVVTTNNKEIARKVAALRNHGNDPDNRQFVTAGNNFRLAEIPSLIGVTQINRLPEILAHRRLIASIYRNELQECPQLSLIDPFPRAGHSYWRYAALISSRINRTLLQKRMHEEFQTRITWMYEPLCHQQPLYKEACADVKLPEAEAVCGNMINLPTHQSVCEDDARRICQGLRSIMESQI